jgi:hypothetical protein
MNSCQFAHSPGHFISELGGDRPLGHRLLKINEVITCHGHMGVDYYGFHFVLSVLSCRYSSLSLLNYFFFPAALGTGQGSGGYVFSK